MLGVPKLCAGAPKMKKLDAPVQQQAASLLCEAQKSLLFADVLFVMIMYGKAILAKLSVAPRFIASQPSAVPFWTWYILANNSQKLN